MKVKQILNRFYVHDIEQAIEFYEKIINEKCSMRFHHPKADLDLAQIGSLLILGGCNEALAPFRETQATFLVDSVSEFRDFLLKSGAVIIRDVTEVPTGFNMTVRHPDGTVAEYVEHKNNV